MFDSHKLNQAGQQKADGICQHFQRFLEAIEQSCAPAGEMQAGAPPAPGGREMALVRTHLEIASFYAKRAMAMQKENQMGKSQ